MFKTKTKKQQFICNIKVFLITGKKRWACDDIWTLQRCSGNIKKKKVHYVQPGSRCRFPSVRPALRGLTPETCPDCRSRLWQPVPQNNVHSDRQQLQKKKTVQVRLEWTPINLPITRILLYTHSFCVKASESPASGRWDTTLVCCMYVQHTCLSNKECT